MGESQHPYTWAVEGPPLGIWRTAEGTFSAVMGAVITFNVDGTGSVTKYSAMFGDEVSSILWEQPAAGVLRIYQANDDYPYPEVDANWDMFRYRAKGRASDAGGGPVLVNDGVEGGWLKAGGFWTLDGPLQLDKRFN